MANIQKRRISGKGILKVPRSNPNYKICKILSLTSTVIRPPSQEYLNFNYNPPRSRYATLVYLSQGMVLKEEQVEYLLQTSRWYGDISAQVLYAVKCAYAGILQTFVNLGIALPRPPFSVNNGIAEWKHTDLFFDEVRCVCYADTAIQLDLITVPYDLCTDDEDTEPTPPPPPPDPPVEETRGVPILPDSPDPLSPPYEGEDDDGNTIPNPLDVPEDVPPPPPERTCTPIRLKIDGYRASDDQIESSNTIFVFGDLIDVRLTPDGSSFGFESYGSPLFTGVCTPAPVFQALVSGYPAGFFGRVEYTELA